MEILAARAPEASSALSQARWVAFVQASCALKILFQETGVAETIDWRKCLLALDGDSLSPKTIADTLALF